MGQTAGGAGPIHPESDRVPGGGAAAALPPDPLAVFLLATWLGVVTGLLELGLRLAQQRLWPAVTLAMLRTNRHYLWMLPVSDLVLFGACGLLLGIVVRIGPRFAARLAAYVLGFLAALALLLGVRGLHAAAGVLMAGGIAARAVPWVAARAARLRGLVRWSLPVLAGGVAVLAGLESVRVLRAEPRMLARLPAAAPGAPNVLLIVLDTVRADHLSLYGYGRETSPQLERLARRGIRFERARATAPWTLPSHASMLTGRWPHELSTSAVRPLDATFPTLAEFLGSRGYATAGFVANTFYCNAWYGLDRGFARYEDFDENDDVTPGEVLRSSALGRRIARLAGAGDDPRPGVEGGRKTAAMINRDALAWLDRQRGRPFFVFLNYFDAHAPYQTPAGFRPRFGLSTMAPSDQEAILRDFHRLGRRNGSSATEDARRAADVIRAATELRRDRYDDCIAALDEQLGRLFDALERRALLANTLVIVTADHGEHLGDHHLFGHGHSLYRPLLDVPLLILYPPGVPAGRTVRAPVSLRDLPATVADLLGLGRASPFPGRSLARHWSPGPAPSEPLLSEVEHQKKFAPSPAIPASRGPMESLVAEGRIYIRHAEGREELYDLEHDPAESHDLVNSPDAGPVLERFRRTRQQFLQAESPARRRQ